MPILFIHGVNVRDTDRDYRQAVAARRVLFERLVAKKISHEQHLSLAVAEDVYWGDLGVKFAWGLKSVPETDIIQSLGGGEAAGLDNADLIFLLTQPRTGGSGGNVRALGRAGDQLLAQAARENPGQVVRAIFASEAKRFDPVALSDSPALLDESERQAAESEGEQLALILLAVESLATSAETNPVLIQGENDDEVISNVQREMTRRYQALVAELRESRRSEVQNLGLWDDATDWAKRRIDSVVKGAKAIAKRTADFFTGIGEEAARGASLLLLKAARDDASQRGLRFLGDAFVYLRHGHSGDIEERVRDAIISAAKRTNPDGIREPLVLVTHSFGSIITYDLLSAGKLDDIKIDLWVTVGAQASLFAEMRLYGASDAALPSTVKPWLGKPIHVTRWLNFYDAADVLSYLHEPVFGSDAVTDIPVREGANLANAHGHYFVTPSFYARISQELAAVLSQES